MVFIFHEKMANIQIFTFFPPEFTFTFLLASRDGPIITSTFICWSYAILWIFAVVYFTATFTFHHLLSSAQLSSALL
jgi:hypothetical protein